jgi:small subunit ribosomal protein S16
MGGHKKPFYRIVVADSDSPRDGRFIEVIGHYDPQKKPADIHIKADRIKAWMSKGAKPTLTVSQLMKKTGIVSVA